MSDYATEKAFSSNKIPGNSKSTLKNNKLYKCLTEQSYTIITLTDNHLHY